MKNPILKLISLTSIPVQSYNTFTSLRLHRVHTKRERKPASKVLKTQQPCKRLIIDQSGVERSGVEIFYFDTIRFKAKSLGVVYTIKERRNNNVLISKNQSYCPNHNLVYVFTIFACLKTFKYNLNCHHDAAHYVEFNYSPASQYVGQYLLGCYRYHFSKSPDFSLVKRAFPSPKNYRSSRVFQYEPRAVLSDVHKDRHAVNKYSFFIKEK